jgi:hypothetical protein
LKLEVREEQQATRNLVQLPFILPLRVSDYSKALKMKAVALIVASLAVAANGATAHCVPIYSFLQYSYYVYSSHCFLHEYSSAIQMDEIAGVYNA